MKPSKTWKLWRLRILMIFAVIGPGFITANVDNDPNGIFTYSLDGSRYGYLLLWTLIPTTIALIVVQEMSARMGAVTGKGLSDLIREEFGLRTTFVIMIGLVAANFLNIVGEFAGIAMSLDLFRVSKFLSVPIAAAVVWLLVVKGNYKSVEKIFLVASFFYVCYIVAGVMAKPAWETAMMRTIVPPSWGAFREKEYVYLIVATVGTTIAPWMQFYLQSSIVEKGVTARQYTASRLDVILGCIFTDVVAWFIVVACAATIYASGGKELQTAAEAAQALKPLAGQWASILFGAGLFNASLFAASILPLSTAYSVSEGLGFESGVDKKFSEAPVFYWLYTVLIVLGAAVVLWPRFTVQHLLKITVFSQFINGALLPFILIYMLRLINKHDLMGQHTNSRAFNWIAWTTTALMIGLTLTLLVMA
jgi:Mn2+/Fe2+ NRAMP family transporter